MTVAELIELLQKFPQHKTVQYEYGDNIYGSMFSDIAGVYDDDNEVVITDNLYIEK